MRCPFAPCMAAPRRSRVVRAFVSAGVSLLVGATLLVGSGDALAQPCAGLAPEPPQAPGACPQLFGDVERHEANKARRQDALHSVWRSGKDVNVTYNARWSAPLSLGLRKLELLAALPEAPDGPVACVRLRKPLAEGQCPAGVYPVPLDASLGSNTALLAVVEGVALVEHGGRLATLSAADAPAYTWRMSWRSPWRVARPVQGSSGSGGARPAARTSSRAPHRPATPRKPTVRGGRK